MFISDKNPKDHRGMTPLHLAALNKHENIVTILLQFAEEKNPKDIKGWTPLRLIGAKYGRWKMKDAEDQQNRYLQRTWIMMDDCILKFFQLFFNNFEMKFECEIKNTLKLS